MKKHLFLSLLLTVWVSLSFAQATLYSESFASGFNTCSTIDHNGTAGSWVYSHNPIVSPYLGNVTLSSPTAANGFALMLSDGVTAAVNTDLITPAINCSGNSNVALQFNHWLQATTSSTVAVVSVSTDSVNWTTVFDAIQNYTGLNPEVIQINISAVAANQPKVYVKFNYQATNDIFWAVDDIKVFTLPDYDVAVKTAIVPDFIGKGNVTIQANVENLGSQTLSSVQLTYRINNGTPVTETFNGLSVTTFNNTTLQFTTPAALDTVASFTATVSSALPNGSADLNTLNDTATKKFITLSHVVNKNVLLEEFSTAVCGYCPGGLTKVEQIMSSADSAFVIPVTIHAGFYTDGMTTADDNSLAAAFTNAAPTANIDREFYPGNSTVAMGVSGMGTLTDEWQTAAEAEHILVPPASISASNTYDSATRVLSVTVHSTFYGPATGVFRLNCYIIEDSVVGAGAGYDQHSYYFSSPTTLNPWLNVGVNGAQYATIAGFVHHRVERKLMNGVWGTAGAIPATTVDGTTYSQTYTYTLPSTWRTNFISLVPFVAEYSTNHTSSGNMIINATSMKLNSADSSNTTVGPNAITETPVEIGKINLYPNPAKDVVTLAYTLDNDAKLSFELYNMVGQLASVQGQSNYNRGNYSTRLNTAQLSNGVYFIAVKDENKVVQTLKFIIAK